MNLKFWHACVIIMFLLTGTFVISVFVGNNDQQGGAAMMLTGAAIGTFIVWVMEEDKL